MLSEEANVKLQVSKGSDARTGNKSADFGYKHHFAMTKEGIIMAVIATFGKSCGNDAEFDCNPRC